MYNIIKDENDGDDDDDDVDVDGDGAYVDELSNRKLRSVLKSGHV